MGGKRPSTLRFYRSTAIEKPGIWFKPPNIGPSNVLQYVATKPIYVVTKPHCVPQVLKRPICVCTPSNQTHCLLAFQRKDFLPKGSGW